MGLLERLRREGWFDKNDIDLTDYQVALVRSGETVVTTARDGKRYTVAIRSDADLGNLVERDILVREIG